MTYKWKLVALLFCCGALNYADRAATTAVFPLFRQDLGITNIGMAALGSFFLWSYALGSPFSGQLADRLSRSRLVVYSLAGWSLITLGTGFVTTVNQLLVTRVLLGFAECLYLPAAIALIADHHGPKTYASALGVHTAGLSIGLVAGGSAAGYLGAHFGWQFAFRALGALGLLLAVLAHFYLRDSEPVARKVSTETGWTDVVTLFRLPTFLIIISEALLVAVGNNIFINWLPLYFSETYHLSLAGAGFSGTFLLQFSAVIGAAFGGAISDRAGGTRGRRRMLVQCLCYLVAAPLVLTFLAQPALPLIAVSIFLFGLLRATGSANEHPVLCDLLTPRMRSTAIGIMNATNCLAGGIGVFVAGALKSTYGLGAVFGGISIVMLASAALLFVGYRFISPRNSNSSNLPAVYLSDRI
ncbi:MAG: MFS transporter [Acidobacteriota bacterium]